MLDRFDLISWPTPSPDRPRDPGRRSPLPQAPFPVYVAIWYVTDLGGDLFAWFLGWREIKRHGLLEGLRPTLKPTVLPGAWRFAIDVNLATSVQAVWGPIGRLVVGGLLGPAGAALFRIASTLADSAQKPADLLGKAFYPEVVRMDLTSNKPWKLMLRSSALVSGVALLAILLMIFGGRPLMMLLFGKAFLGAYEPLVILTAVPFIGIFSFPLRQCSMRSDARTGHSRPSCSAAPFSSSLSRPCPGRSTSSAQRLPWCLPTRSMPRR